MPAQAAAHFKGFSNPAPWSGTTLSMSSAAELPRGTVTFLFTDIEGSTRLLKQLRDHYEKALDEHQRILRAAFDEHGGREIDTQGDSFFVAFPRAKDAVAAAVEAQRGPCGAEMARRGGTPRPTPALDSRLPFRLI
jgi:class 3 adenylate cyclase